MREIRKGAGQLSILAIFLAIPLLVLFLVAELYQKDEKVVLMVGMLGVILGPLPWFYVLSHTLDAFDKWFESPARPPRPRPLPKPDTAALERQRQAELAAFNAAPKLLRCRICSSVMPEHLTNCPNCRSNDLILIRADLPR